MSRVSPWQQPQRSPGLRRLAAHSLSAVLKPLHQPGCASPSMWEEAVWALSDSQAGKGPWMLQGGTSGKPVSPSRCWPRHWRPASGECRFFQEKTEREGKINSCDGGPGRKWCLHMNPARPPLWKGKGDESKKRVTVTASSLILCGG